jgi:hypothetical protein
MRTNAKYMWLKVMVGRDGIFRSPCRWPAPLVLSLSCVIECMRRRRAVLLPIAAWFGVSVTITVTATAGQPSSEARRLLTCGARTHLLATRPRWSAVGSAASRSAAAIQHRDPRACIDRRDERRPVPCKEAEHRRQRSRQDASVLGACQPFGCRHESGHAGSLESGELCATMADALSLVRTTQARRPASFSQASSGASSGK